MTYKCCAHSGLQDTNKTTATSHNSSKLIRETSEKIEKYNIFQ